MRILKSIFLSVILTGLAPSVSAAPETDFEKDFSYWHKQLMNWDIHQNEGIIGILIGIKTSHAIHDEQCYEVLSSQFTKVSEFYDFYASLVKTRNPSRFSEYDIPAPEVLALLINMELQRRCEIMKSLK